MDAFDADVLIYAVKPEHELGRRVRALMPPAATGSDDPTAGVGSMMLLQELLAKPLREGAAAELNALLDLLGRLDLQHIDRATASVATTLAAKYRLHAADATHLATAVVVGADRFITNNQKDFPKTISEVDVVYPADLPEVN